MSRLKDYNKGVEDERKRRKEGDSIVALWVSFTIVVIGLAYYSRNDWAWFMNLLMTYGY